MDLVDIDHEVVVVLEGLAGTDRLVVGTDPEASAACQGLVVACCLAGLVGIGLVAFVAWSLDNFQLGHFESHLVAEIDLAAFVAYRGLVGIEDQGPLVLAD